MEGWWEARGVGAGWFESTLAVGWAGVVQGLHEFGCKGGVNLRAGGRWW